MSDRLSPLQLNSNASTSSNVSSSQTKLVPLAKINSLTNNVSELRLSDDSKQKNKTSIGNNQWHIDLTLALRDTKSAPLVTKISKHVEEDFDMPFIDCESNAPEFNDILYECKMDISDVLKQKYRLSKKVSKFGKVLCYKYKKTCHRPFDLTDPYKQKCRKFYFDCPSPDDVILTNLKKK